LAHVTAKSNLHQPRPYLSPPILNRKIGAIQRGPDKRLYVAREDNPALGVIQFPDSLGKASRYVDEGVKLGGRRSKLGLPTFVVGASLNKE